MKNPVTRTYEGGGGLMYTGSKWAFYTGMCLERLLPSWDERYDTTFGATFSFQRHVCLTMRPGKRRALWSGATISDEAQIAMPYTHRPGYEC